MNNGSPAARRVQQRVYLPPPPPPSLSSGCIAAPATHQHARTQVVNRPIPNSPHEPVLLPGGRHDRLTHTRTDGRAEQRAQKSQRFIARHYSLLEPLPCVCRAGAKLTWWPPSGPPQAATRTMRRSAGTHRRSVSCLCSRAQTLPETPNGRDSLALFFVQLLILVWVKLAGQFACPLACFEPPLAAGARPVWPRRGQQTERARE